MKAIQELISWFANFVPIDKDLKEMMGFFFGMILIIGMFAAAIGAATLGAAWVATEQNKMAAERAEADAKIAEAGARKRANLPVQDDKPTKR